MDTAAQICIRYNGKLFIVKRAAFEPIYRTYERGWYIAKNQVETAAEMDRVVCESHKKINTEIGGMGY